MSDILTYKPKVAWNNTIINFGMPSIAGNLRLTEICLESQDCLTATKGAMELSFTQSVFEKARTPPVLEVVRTLFGADTGIEIETSAAIYETHDIETYVPGVGPSLVDVDWLVDISKDVDIALHKTSDISHNRKDVWNPRGLTYTAINRPVVGNWDTDGEPGYKISWLPFWHQYCSDGTSTNQVDCLAHAFDGYCRQTDNRTESVVRGNPYPTGTGSEIVPYDSTDLVRHTTSTNCWSGYYWGNHGGGCSYSQDNGQTWSNYGQNWTKEQCLDTITQANTGWDYLWWKWAANDNTWTSINHNWFPSLDSYNNFKEYRIKTASSIAMQEYPLTHMTHTDFTATTPIEITVYESDVNTAYGNGEDVYGAYFPVWISNVYDWPDYDNMYAAPVDVFVCSDTSYHCSLASVHVPEWTDETSCLNAGVCTNTAYDNDEAGCLAEGTCIEDANYDNNSVACLAHAYTWVPSGNTFSNPGNAWGIRYPDEVSCLAGGFTWDFSHTEPLGATIIPTKEVEIPVDEDYYIKTHFPAHTFVADPGNLTGSRPTGQYGYTGNQGLVDSSKIRWMPPMYNYSNWQHTYMRPTKFRIYRSPYYSPNGLTLTDSDYEADIWKYAGEVPCVSENSYHYFYDTREDMFNEGLDAYQQAYYGITAVWEGWNWKRGYTIKRYNNMSNSSWDIYTNSNANIDAFEGLTPDYEYENNIININDNTNNRTHRVSGYMKAPYTGQYRFWLNSDDAMYVWKGGAGETVESILTWRTWYNATVDEPGSHGDRSEYSAYFNLNEGDIIPILMYHGQGGGGMTLQFQIWYATQTWDNGQNNTGGWHYKPVYMMPQEGNPNGLCSDPLETDQVSCEAASGTWTAPIGDGQTVEGYWPSSNVPSNYRN